MLLDQIVAIALLGVLVASIFSVLTAGSLAAQMAREFSLAGGLAAKKLEEITAACEEPAGVSRQALDPQRFPRYEWQVDVAEVTPPLCQVTVTVWWPQRGRERSVSLTTLVRRQEER